MVEHSYMSVIGNWDLIAAGKIATYDLDITRDIGPTSGVYPLAHVDFAIYITSHRDATSSGGRSPCPLGCGS